MILSQFHALPKGKDAGINEGQDEVVAKRTSVRNTVDVGAFWAEVWVAVVVEHDKAQQVEEENDGGRHHHEAQLLGTVPLANVDVGHKNKRGQDAENEAAYLGEVVNVGKCAKNCMYE